MFSTILAVGLAAGAADCGCAATFSDVVDAVETHYAGYVVKLPDEKSHAAYERFRDLLLQDAARAAEAAECRPLLDAYLAFFADESLFVKSVTPDSDARPGEPAGKPAQTAAAPDIPNLKARWTPEKVRFRLRRESDLDPVEGLWRDSEGELAIVHDEALRPREYVAFRFKQRYYGGAGEILAFIRPAGDGSYDIHYKDASGTWQKARALLNNESGILGFGGIGWQRTTDPAEQTGERPAAFADAKTEAKKDEQAPELPEATAGDPLNPVFRDLGDGVHYLSIPSFMPRFRAPLEKLIESHAGTLENARGLVVDVRGNAGGEAIHAPLMDYLLNGPVTVSEDSAILASSWNIEYVEKLRAQQGEQDNQLDQVLERMRANRGEIVPYLPGRTYSPQPVDGPDAVVVLQDRGTGGEAEAFLRRAGQGGKVVTIGEPSKGNLDYRQVNTRTLGCGAFAVDFGYPLYMRSATLPEGSIDDRGIAPDVRLAPALGDWVSYARRWLRHGARQDAE